MANVRRILAGNNDAWVEFKPSGYPFKLRRQLKEASDDEAVLTIILPFVVNCQIPREDGTFITGYPILDNLMEIDEQLVSDIIWKFYDFRGERLREPLSKNI